MNDFASTIRTRTGNGLQAADLGTVQVNVGLKCNQACRHCHLEAAAGSEPMMEWSTMSMVIDAAKSAECRLVDITGGAPEMNPHLRRFVQKLREQDLAVQVRTNLTVFHEEGMESLPEFYADNEVQLVASMPCYLEENVRAQRGPGVYDKSVESIRQLNTRGYGADPNLPLNLVYNPGGAFLPPGQTELERDYRKQLESRFGLVFTRLLTISNVPIGRFLADLRQKNEEETYRQLLKTSYNAATVEHLMCRHQISVGPDGTLYDCDFNLALGIAVDRRVPGHISRFDPSLLAARTIATAEHCFACTAGAGSSCAGALA